MAADPHTIEPNPPLPMSWEEYKATLDQRWKALLNSPNSQEEKNLQSFLEEHPCLIPGAFGLNFSSGHFPFPCAVVTQPILKGLGTKVPDFMWIASDSGTIYPILVEIETATKRWFTKNGIPHSDFTQAHTQLASWKTWFDSPTNQQVFLEYYRIPSSLRDTRNLRPMYVLIYGRRGEFDNKPALNAMRTNLQRSDETLMTFDRLAPEEKARDMMCVRLVENSAGCQYHALTIPATLMLGDLGADYRSVINDKEDAIKKNMLISKERKEFLIRRMPYWDNLVRTRSGLYSINLSATE